MHDKLVVTPADRLTVATVGAYCLFAGRVLHSPAGRPGTTPIDAVMPWAFAAAGLACIIFVAALTGHRLQRLEQPFASWSGALVVLAFASRSIAILIGLQQQTLTIGDQRAWLGVATWATFAILAATYWLQVIRPLIGARRYRRR